MYSDMIKYGVDNFSIDLLEQCDQNISEEREKFWIRKLNTYNYGYNMTLGGKYDKHYDYLKIVEKYAELRNVTKTAKFFNCTQDTVRNACNCYGVKIVKPKNNNKHVIQLSYDGKTEIQEFVSITDAAEYIRKSGKSKSKVGNNNINTHISDVCKGRRKSAYGYLWKFR